MIAEAALVLSDQRLGIIDFLQKEQLAKPYVRCSSSRLGSDGWEPILNGSLHPSGDVCPNFSDYPSCSAIFVCCNFVAPVYCQI